MLVTRVDLLSYCKIQYFAINTEQVYSKTIKYMVKYVSSCENKVKNIEVLTAGTSNYEKSNKSTGWNHTPNTELDGVYDLHSDFNTGIQYSRLALVHCIPTFLNFPFLFHPLLKSSCHYPLLTACCPESASLQWLTLTDSLWRANSDLSIAAGEITRGQRKERTSEAGE